MQRVLCRSGSLARAVLSRPTAALALGAGVQQIARQFAAAAASQSRRAAAPPAGAASEGERTGERKGIRVGFFSAHNYEIGALRGYANQEGVTPDSELLFFTNRLTEHTTKLAEDCEAVVLFVNDQANAKALRRLHARGTRAIFLRCAGFDMVDLAVAKELGMPVVRVPAYSPFAIAEHASALMMTLNRKTHRAYNRTREQNFRLTGLLGYDLNGKTVGVVGTGKIGAIFCRIAKGYGCRVIAYDVAKNPEALSYGAEYTSLDNIWAQSDIISLHCPLFPTTRHMINAESIAKMKDGVMLINTSRGALVHTPALVEGLKSNKISAAGLDVFEGEEGYFYSDRSGEIIADDMLARLFMFPNVVITGHQAFFTEEALGNIAQTTIQNIKAFVNKEELVNAVKL